ncbi:MAG: hypothetical protein WBL63_04895 [Candidatus Acidiferrum sp.]
MKNTLWLVCVKALMALALLGALGVSSCRAQGLELKNDGLAVQFGPRGLLAITDQTSGATIHFAQDEFTLVVNEQLIDSSRLTPTVKTEDGGLVYLYSGDDYSIRVIYELRKSWRFVTKRLEVLDSPTPNYTLAEVRPLRLSLRDPIENSFAPAAYLPQFGPSGDSLVAQSLARQFGVFLRFKDQRGLMLVVQNPFLEVARSGHDVSIDYKPEMTWRKEWGPWSSDLAVIAPYRQSGKRIPARMVHEWKDAANADGREGADENEIQAFADCVRAFLLHPSPSPVSVEVGWTLNDYQIDVATVEGRAEYKRVMDISSDLGIQNLLYAPANHGLAEMENDADDWNWEHVLWLGLGQKIRKGEWDVEKSPIPESVSEMLDYAKSKHLGILAYVYPSLPFAQNPDWIVKDSSKKSKNSYATLASRDFQDFLIHELIAFKRRTGIAGYSFDYTFFNIPGSGVYSQWYGWRRVMESLRGAEPDTIIDGRQTYQTYGPWTWLAGSYPHPTGNDEQPESFTPYPDLHFDRVSANRTRFVNYWYRNYEFAPHEVVPGYMTHQTPRNRNVSVADGSNPKAIGETVYTGFRRRDWDYLGYKYSILSSIATGSWNNVVDMIPARDPAEFERFSEADKSWIRNWLQWTIDNKEVLKQTKTILGQPAMGQVDGTAAVRGDHGFVFLFNPNYKTLRAEVRLDDSMGLTETARFVLREIYPEKGRLIGKTGEGIWTYGDALSIALEGTSAKVLELVPASEFEKNVIVFGLDSIDPQNPPRATLEGGVLRIEHAAGEVGSKDEVSVVLPAEQLLKGLEINGKSVPFIQQGRRVSAAIAFAGAAFSRSQEVPLGTLPDGSLTGTFTVPSRIQTQLARRRELWPIPWTKEDYTTTWLVPERLLLFVQVAEPSDSMAARAEVDGFPLQLIPAYSSVRQHSGSFVGWYADVSTISVDKPHTIRLTLPRLEPGRFQGLFFDNVEDEYTEQLAP